MPQDYGHHWRTVTLVRIRQRAGGAFKTVERPQSVQEVYVGGATCERCGYVDHMPEKRTKAGFRPVSELDSAHLVVKPGQEGHDDDTNLALLCRRCHRQHDYAEWAVKFREWLRKQRETLPDRRDAQRPILVMLREQEKGEDVEHSITGRD